MNFESGNKNSFCFFFAINTNFYVNTCFIWYFLHKKEQEIKKKNEKPGLMKTKPDADMSA